VTFESHFKMSEILSLVADNTRRWLPNKVTRSFVAASFIGFCYALLFGLKAKDHFFPIIGGIVGAMSAVSAAIFPIFD
jgi:hypothetical protein